MQTTIHSNKTQSHRANNADGALGADGSIIQESTALAVGLLIYSLLRAIPFGIGWVIGAIVTLLSLGSFVIVLHRAPHPQAVIVPPPVSRGREIPVQTGNVGLPITSV